MAATHSATAQESTQYNSVAPEPDQFLTLAELSALLKVEPCSIYNARRAGNDDPIPAVSVGRFLRFRKSAVLEWFARQEATTITHRPFKPRRQARKLRQAAKAA